jgi:hypothetical protein
MAKILKIIFGLSVLGGAIFLVRFLMTPEPQLLLREAQKNLLSSKAFHYQVDAEIKGDLTAVGLDEKGGPASITVHTSNEARLASGGRVDSDSKFDISFDGSGIDRNISGASQKKEGIHYLKIEKADGFDKATEAMIGQWTRSHYPFWRQLVPSDDERFREPLEPPALVTLRQAISGVDLFEVTEKLPTQDITATGELATGFRVKMSRDAAAAILLKLRELKTGLEQTSDDVIEVALQTALMGEPEGEIWIAKKSRLPLELHLRTKLDADGTTTEADLKVVFQYRDRPAAEPAPSGAVDFDVLANEAMEGSLRLSAARAAQAPAAQQSASASGETKLDDAAGTAGTSDSDGDGLDDSSEFLFKADPWNPDSDADGYFDGQEVNNGMNPTGPGVLFSFGLGQ